MAKAYVKNVLIGIDQLVNVLIGGYPDESISSRAYRNRRLGGWGYIYSAINMLFFWQENHCYAAHVAELKLRQMPPSLRPDRPRA